MLDQNILIFLKNHLDAEIIEKSVFSYLVDKTIPNLEKLLSERFDCKNQKFTLTNDGFGLTTPRAIEIKLLNISVDGETSIFIETLEELSLNFFKQIPIKDKQDYLDWLIARPSPSKIEWYNRALKIFAILVENKYISYGLVDPDIFVRRATEILVQEKQKQSNYSKMENLCLS